MSRLSAVRATSFLDTTHPSLKMPALTATVRFDETKTETVTFGRSGTESFASRSDEPGTAILDAMAFDEVVKAIDALK
jgi:hypothetical protein